jgi:hypothetical protein
MYFALGLFSALALLLAIYVPASLAVATAWRWLDPLSTAWNPQRRAGLLFGLRILPATAALLFLALCAAPAYLAFEPRETGESISVKLAAAAGLAACGIALSAWRAVHSWLASRRLIAAWMRDAKPASVAGIAMAAYRFDHPFPIMAVAGILRPRLLIANRLLDALRPEEMAAAVAHELGHVAARDNLHRFLLRLCPNLGALCGAGRELDQAWEEAAEAAADAHAVHRRSVSALDLASALIKTARLAPRHMNAAVPSCALLLSPFSRRGLAGRIERLTVLAGHDPSAVDFPAPSWMSACAAMVGLSLLTALVTSPAFLRTTYEALEHFVRLLS